MIKNKWRGKFILVEGMDGAGKTTILKAVLPLLQKNYPVVYLKGMGRDTFFGRIAKRFAKTIFFLLELAYVTFFELRSALKRGQVVLMDKYFFFVESHIPETDTKLNRFLLRCFKPLMIKPDKIIYFTVSPEERTRRLKSLPWSRHHQRLIDNPGWSMRRELAYIQAIRKSGAPVIYLGNTGDVAMAVELFKDLVAVFPEV